MAKGTDVDSALQEKADRLKGSVHDFVEHLLDRHKPSPPRGPKVINDALLGNQYFAAHEVAVIDSPLLQRLKRIKQTGLVSQVYPSARHSRFEHSLGTTTIAERVYKAIRDRAFLEEDDGGGSLQEDRKHGDMAELRLAALLHDVGHGLCSHLAEQIYEQYTFVRELTNRHPRYMNNAPGEIISYFVVTSPPFREWMEEIFKELKVEIDLDTVAEMILGDHPDPENKQFLGQIISSPYDADKLDYIARDSYHCGLALTVDLPRFYSMIATAKSEQTGGKRILVLRSYVPLEQILFSKMTLFGSVYHHQKVKCLDHMVRSICRYMAEHPNATDFSIGSRKITFGQPIDFLYPTDAEFFNQVEPFGDSFVDGMIDRINDRSLLKRALAISRRTIENWSSGGGATGEPSDARAEFIMLEGRPRRVEQLEAEIHKNLPPKAQKNCDKGEILLNIPAPPKIKTENAYVQKQPGGPIENIEEYFPVNRWTESYASNKWNSYLYAPPEYREQVRDAAIDVLEREIGLYIDREKSDNDCHLL